jgi:hypothetical protein
LKNRQRNDKRVYSIVNVSGYNMYSTVTCTIGIDAG